MLAENHLRMENGSHGVRFLTCSMLRYNGVRNMRLHLLRQPNQTVHGWPTHDKNPGMDQLLSTLLPDKLALRHERVWKPVHQIINAKYGGLCQLW